MGRLKPNTDLQSLDLREEKNPLTQKFTVSGLKKKKSPKTSNLKELIF